MENEHDDDLDPVVDDRGEMETEDYPRTADDLDAGESDEPAADVDDDDVVGK